MMKTQRQMIYEFNDNNRPKFNRDLFIRKDEELIEAMKNVIYSCERNSSFVIKVMNFEVIDNYDDINHILFEYEQSIIDKSKNSSSNKKKDNPFAFINLRGSDLILLKVTYFIQITEKKNGLVNDTITTYIAIPRLVDNFYFRLNGNIYSAMYQIVDASTYNNSAAKNAKKQSITFKTVFMPIRIYRYSKDLKDIDGNSVNTTYFIANIFKKSIFAIKYILAKFGYYGAMNFLKIREFYILDDISNVDRTNNYIFPCRDLFLVVPRMLFDSNQLIQSFVYTIHAGLIYMKDVPAYGVFANDIWVRYLGVDFATSKNGTANYEPVDIYNKGKSILDSLDFIYDLPTKKDLKLPESDKENIHCVLRWMMYEFNALRQKDNLDITTKKVRWAEYLASLYASKLAGGIYRISDKGDNADLGTIRKAIQITPMFLISAISKCQLVNYKSCVNDMDSILALKYTYKGIAGIGEKANAISSGYRSIHPSHLGRVDIDSSSSTDPGISGTICPYTTLYDGHFTEYQEPDTWEYDWAKVLDIYNSINSKKEMVRLISDIGKSKQNNNVHLEAVDKTIAKLTNFAKIYNYTNEEYIHGLDIIGDGKFYLGVSEDTNLDE